MDMFGVASIIIPVFAIIVFALVISVFVFIIVAAVRNGGNPNQPGTTRSDFNTTGSSTLNWANDLNNPASPLNPGNPANPMFPGNPGNPI